MISSKSTLVLWFFCYVILNSLQSEHDNLTVPLFNVSSKETMESKSLFNVATRDKTKSKSLFDVSTEVKAESEHLVNASTKLETESKPLFNVSTKVKTESKSIVNVSSKNGTESKVLLNGSTLANTESKSLFKASTKFKTESIARTIPISSFIGSNNDSKLFNFVKTTVRTNPSASKNEAIASKRASIVMELDHSTTPVVPAVSITRQQGDWTSKHGSKAERKTKEHKPGFVTKSLYDKRTTFWRKPTTKKMQKKEESIEEIHPQLMTVEDEQLSAFDIKNEELGSSEEEYPDNEPMSGDSEESGEHELDDSHAGYSSAANAVKPVETTSKNLTKGRSTIPGYNKTMSNEKKQEVHLGASNMNMRRRTLHDARNRTSMRNTTAVDNSTSVPNTTVLVGNSTYTYVGNVSHLRDNTTHALPANSSSVNTTVPDDETSEGRKQTKKKMNEKKEGGKTNSDSDMTDWDRFLTPSSTITTTLNRTNGMNGTAHSTKSINYTEAAGGVGKGRATNNNSVNGEKSLEEDDILKCWSCSSLVSFDCEKLEIVFGEPSVVGERMTARCRSGYCGYFTWTTDYGYGFTMHQRACAVDKQTFCNETNPLLEMINTTSMVQSCNVCDKDLCNASPGYSINMMLIIVTMLKTIPPPILRYLHWKNVVY